ncbi:hypothetical protein A3I27_00275 [Candidatus Giovannonibacteria bacterium RIFCSPLOWO2_02_FULL_43_11b]|nr:MAG: hypothetical protein A3B97_02760 [Candidatus Giovannonibacteria bacterium RIFCSPHIGHO2_02_FULL_43_32]OGF90431.1 MAG: hypothetical protein A3I27_00275 [Candidatus Giovannonibacteria bacterium RIFCSPLOWO2_02_FULL_43_11b]OHB03530.1 MAG: hypothetical protein A3B03_00070 [Candidatus Zambryskibacteria bacterium RIFCSPLOWO2_01_FULL_42_41]
MGKEHSKTYRMYVDESGDHTYSEDKRFLGLTGVIFESQNYKNIFHSSFEKFKEKHFPHNPDEPVILHRREILDKSGPFWRLRDEEKRKSFNNDFIDILKKSEFKLITVVIDKKAHFDRYKESALHPYHFCLVALLERYCGVLNYYNVKGDVLAESRGGREDMQLKEAYKNVYESGTNFRKQDFFQKSLTSKEIKIKPKSANIAGLQLADLLAHPCVIEILYEKKHITNWDGEYERRICECINKKYNKHLINGRIEGYGKVFLG